MEQGQPISRRQFITASSALAAGIAASVASNQLQAASASAPVTTGPAGTTGSRKSDGPAAEFTMQRAMEPIFERMKDPRPIKYVFAGDSITHGALHTWGARDYVEHFSERVRYEMSRRRDVVIKTGISGWTSRHVREDLLWNTLQFDADIISIMLGMNDCAWGRDGVSKFNDNYCCILDELDRHSHPHVILHTMNVIQPSDKLRHDNLPAYVDAIRQLAADRGLPLIDHHAYWTQAIAADYGRLNYWLNDPLHPNSVGHLAMVHLLLKEMGLWDAKSNVCRMFVP